MTDRNAVAYYRHSAEDKQENSVAIQQSLTQQFAAREEIQIIHEEQDQGKSGLTANRPGFHRLFNNWIQNPEAPRFQYILVYDISRWGRFQDQDEAGFYEFLCKKHGKTVVYVNHGFPSAGNELLFSLQKSIERYMAAEYSRQLSDKVFQGSVVVCKQGFSAGGAAAYGMIRILVDEAKNSLRCLFKGEHKAIANQRVKFEPGDETECKVIRDIFRLFTAELRSLTSIAEKLNFDGVPAPASARWRPQTVRRILRNSTYIGTKIYNKTSQKLKRPRRRNHPNDWIVLENAHPAIVEARTYNAAQDLLNKARGNRKSLSSTQAIPQGLSNLPTIFSSPPLLGGAHGDQCIWCFSMARIQPNVSHVICVCKPHRKLPPTVLLVPTSCFLQTGKVLIRENSSWFKICQDAYLQSYVASPDECSAA